MDDTARESYIPHRKVSELHGAQTGVEEQQQHRPVADSQHTVAFADREHTGELFGT